MAERQRATALAAESREDARRAQLEAAKRASLEAAVEAEGRLSFSDLAAEADWRLDSAEDYQRSEAICNARWILGKASSEEQRSDPLTAKLKKVERAEQQRLRREAMSNRVLVCANGDYSSCPCTGTHRGCCSHHGGVSHCERIEEPTIVCARRTEREHVEAHMTAMGRLSKR